MVSRTWKDSAMTRWLLIGSLVGLLVSFTGCASTCSSTMSSGCATGGCSSPAASCASGGCGSMAGGCGAGCQSGGCGPCGLGGCGVGGMAMGRLAGILGCNACGGGGCNGCMAGPLGWQSGGLDYSHHLQTGLMGHNAAQSLNSRPFTPGPPTGQVAYPYYTVRGPRDFLLDQPPTIGR